MATFLTGMIQNAQGLNQLLAQKDERERRTQQFRDIQDASGLLKQYQQSVKAGNPNQEILIEATLKSPDLAEQVLGAMGVTDKAQLQQAAADSAELWQLKDNPQMFMGKLAQRANAIAERGGDPVDTIELAKLYAQDPEQAVMRLKSGAAALEAKGYKTGVFDGGSGNKPAGVAEFEYFGKLSPDEQKTFTELKRGKQLTPDEQIKLAQEKSDLEKETALTKEEQKLGVKDLRDIADRGRVGSGQVGVINRLEQLNDKAFDGAGAGIKLQLAKIGESLGLDIEGLPESEQMTALSNELVLGKSQQMTGALSNADMEFLSNTAPTLSQTKEGRKKIMEYARKLAERDREYAKAAQRFRTENGYFNLSEFNQQFDAENKPLFEAEEMQSGESVEVIDWSSL